MRHQAERDQVLAVALHWCILSGGMDQSVLAALSHRLQTELGRLACEGEGEDVTTQY
jgi:hypothetical protein